MRHDHLRIATSLGTASLGMKYRIRTHRGFTLIEVLVALGIFAIVASLGYRGLSAMIDAEARLTGEALRWQRIERFLGEFENDIFYAAPRGGRNADGALQPALRGVAAVSNPDEAHLSLTRFHAGQGLTTGVPQRIGYRFAPPALTLLVWPALDAAPGARPDRVVLIDGLRAASTRYQDRAGNWHTAWPPAGLGDEFPLNVELTLDIEGAGRMTRLFGR